MGAPNDALLPAAILMLNPGVNRDEFAELLDGIILGTCPSLKRDWDYVDNKHYDREYHAGLYSVGKFLGLQEKHKVIMNPNVLDDLRMREQKINSFISDRRIDYLDGENFVLAHKFLDGTWQHIYEVVSEHELLTPQPREEHMLSFRPEIGKYFCYINKPYILIDKIHSAEKIEKYKYKVDLEGRTQNWKYNIIQMDFEELRHNYPQYTPQAVFDWDKPQGIINDPYYTDENVKWERTGNKYYLQNPLDLAENTFGDLIVTAEAYKKKAWALFGIHGGMYTTKFLVDHPDSFDTHQREILNHWLYAHAKKNRLSNTEYIRLRLESGIYKKPEPLTDQQALSLVFKEARETHRFEGFTFQRYADFDFLKEYLCLPKIERTHSRNI